MLFLNSSCLTILVVKNYDTIQLFRPIQLLLCSTCGVKTLFELLPTNFNFLKVPLFVCGNTYLGSIDIDEYEVIAYDFK